MAIRNGFSFKSQIFEGGEKSGGRTPQHQKAENSNGRSFWFKQPFKLPAAIHQTKIQRRKGQYAEQENKSSETTPKRQEPGQISSLQEGAAEEQLSLPETLEVKNFFQLAGRIKHFVYEWEKITKNSKILEWVKGIKIPFQSIPEQHKLPHQNLSTHKIFLYLTVIEKLIKKGVISRCEYVKGQFLSSHFLIKKPNGKHRLILNLKPFNTFVKNDHFKMEDYRSALKLMSPNIFMAKIDLKEAYYLLSIDNNYKKYLRFSFKNDLYEFNCLPFGLNIAPLVFTKILKPVAKYLRQRGVKMIIYLDDILLFGDSLDECHHSIIMTKNLLMSLGFLINERKSQLKPTQKIEFLGFMFNSKTMSLSLPIRKRKLLTQLFKKFKQTKICQIRKFASLVGKLVSIAPTQKYGWLHVKPFEIAKLEALKLNNKNFNRKMIFPIKLSQELDWWLKHIKFSKRISTPDHFSLEIFSDASNMGWGACCNYSEANGLWNHKERLYHINWLELRATYFGLKCFAKNKSHCNILLRIDNMTAVACINRMGSTRYRHLNKITKKIWDWCEAKNIFIFASYINTKENIKADFLSRNKSTNNEFELSNKAFSQITKVFGIPQIDLFASKINAKCDKYVSWGPDPDCFCVDAFTLDWQSIFFYAFPPFLLIDRILQKIKNDKATGILIVPDWPSQPWYPVFFSLLIEKPIVFSPEDNLITFPYRNKHPLHKHLSLVAGKLSGRP